MILQTTNYKQMQCDCPTCLLIHKYNNAVHESKTNNKSVIQFVAGCVMNYSYDVNARCYMLSHILRNNPKYANVLINGDSLLYVAFSNYLVGRKDASIINLLLEYD